MSSTKCFESVYQYVGDEAVLTWKKEQGLNHNNCIQLFYDFRNRLNSKSAYFLDRYETVPKFKAGVHLGQVTVTEVGDIKKEIAYHGDVLNTAARLQGACNTYGSSLLVSKQLVDQLAIASSWEQEYLGAMELKGKLTPVQVFSLTFLR